MTSVQSFPTPLPILTAGDSGARRRSTRDEYALAVQKTAKLELGNFKLHKAMQGANWASSLEAAPAAVCVMALLLKTASTEAAAGLKVASPKITGRAGEVVQTLPYELFHTNLQYCSDLGRAAFIESQKIMDLIRKTSNNMIEDGGSVSFIIELLEEPEDAKDNLLPEIKRVEESAQLCLKRIKELCDQFEFWYLVVGCLKNNASEGKGAARTDVTKTKRNKTLVNDDAKFLSDQEAIARQAAEEKKRQLAATIEDVAKARADVERLLAEPSIDDPPHQQELQDAEKAVAEMQPPERDGGAVGGAKKLWKALVGESKKEYEARLARVEDLKRQQKEYIEKKKAERMLARQRAEDRLKLAKDREDKLRAEIEKTRQDLSKKLDEHHSAKAKLAETKAQLKRLGQEKAELETIFTILDTSAEQLAKLNDHVSQLVQFFNAILVEVSTGVEEDVKDFLQPIKRGARLDDDGELERLAIGNASKKRILTKALHIQGSFSAIRDISGTFVEVSKNYIGPAISKMEALASVSEEEWGAKSEEFTTWCDNSMAEIRTLADKTAADMGPNIQKRVLYLQDHAINAAFPE